MARRPRRTRTPDPEVVDATTGEITPVEATETSATDALIEKITATADPNMMFSVVAPIQAAVKRTDGIYRTDTITESNEMVFAGARQGKRGKIIFEFKPVEPTHLAIEWDEDKVFTALGPEFENMVVRGLFEGDGNLSPMPSFADAERIFKREFIAKRRAEQKAAEKEEVKSLTEAYESNPEFGMF